MGGSYSGQVCTTYNRVTSVRITYLLPDRLLGFSCEIQITKWDNKGCRRWGMRGFFPNSNLPTAKSADPQLMKENEVTYPRESGIAGHTKQSSMAEDEDVRQGERAFGQSVQVMFDYGKQQRMSLSFPLNPFCFRRWLLL